MKILKIIHLSILFSGLNTERYSDGKRIHAWKTNPSAINRTGDDGCREMVFTICEEEKIVYPANNRLHLNQQCKKDIFAYYCG